MNLPTGGLGGGSGYNNLPIYGFGGVAGEVGEPVFIVTISHKELYALLPKCFLFLRASLL